MADGASLKALVADKRDEKEPPRNPSAGPPDGRGMQSAQSREVRDRVFGPPGGEGPVQRERELESRERGSGPPADQNERFSSQFLRGLVNMAAGTAGSIGPIPGGPSAGEVVRRGGFPSTGQEIAEATGGVVATEEPEGFRGRMGRMSGAATGMAVPAGGAATAIPRAVGQGGSLIQRLARGVQNIGARSGEAFAQRPARFTSGEAGMGAVAGAGGLVAEREFPDTPAARFVGEMLAPSAVSLHPTGFAVRSGVRNRERLMRSMSEGGAQRRAANRLERSMTPSQRQGALEGMDEPTTVDPETGRPVLTVSQRTGIDGPLALERAVIESSEELRREADEQIANANRVIQERMRGMGGDTEAAAGQMAQGQIDLLDTLNARLRVAAQRTDERIGELGRGASVEQANRIARQELEKARNAARAQEEQLFGMVDPEASVSTSNVQETFADIRDSLGRAQMRDIPPDARTMLNPDSDSFVGDTSNIRELRALQSKLREVGRRASSQDQNNRARIANQLADAIHDDLDTAAGESEALETALNFSRAWRQRFKRGSVGKLMGTEATGGARVREGETLDVALGGRDSAARETLDEIRRALDDPEIAGRTGTDATAFNEAAADFVRRRFLQNSRKGGEFDPDAGRRFIESNEQLLSRLPGVQSELDEAVRSGNIQRVMENRRKSVRTNDPRRSRATLFIQKGPEKAFDEITSMQPNIAAREAQQLLNRVNRDPSGQAKAGLKGGYIDFLMRGEKARDVEGRRFISGQELRERRTNPSVQAVEKRLLSEGERKRLDEITRDLMKLERSREVGAAAEGVVGDSPSRVVEMLSGLTGAAAGRAGAGAAGVGATVQIPGIMANQMRRLADAGVSDPATRLIRDAVRDEDLYRRLLQARLTPEGELPKQAANRLQAWAAGVLGEREQREAREDEPAESRGSLKDLIDQAN